MLDAYDMWDLLSTSAAGIFVLAKKMKKVLKVAEKGKTNHPPIWSPKKAASKQSVIKGG